ncbi:hypothetical protein H2200_007186 [Cladophialophora chaetospira]|uniref:Uncharacterized protein n=1 Tax=Cladophialophora chaetospira TaxID=386627 RepID=A0AA38X7Y1_9EURO|nr:hypothetical protein H2200_007186 [Cladophialophora chaetospira]
MCFIYSATTFLRCRECNAVDFTSGTTCRSLTLCNAGVDQLCRAGLEHLHGHWFQTRPSDEPCRNCDQGVQGEQQRTIESFQQLRGTGGDAGWEPRLDQGMTQGRAAPDMILSLDAAAAQSMRTPFQTADLPPTLARYLRTPSTRDPPMEFGLPITPYLEPQAFTAPSGDYPPLPVLPPDPDFDEMLNIATASAQPALTCISSPDEVDQTGGCEEDGSEFEYS